MRLQDEEDGHAAIRRLELLALVGEARRNMEADGDASRERLARAIEILGGAAPVARFRGGLSPGVRRRITALVEDRLDGDLSVTELAAAAGLSPSYLGRAFHATFGEPPHAYVTRRRLSRARSLMLETDLPLSEVAARCGFADQAHLCRLFRAASGLPPARWRRLKERAAA